MVNPVVIDQFFEKVSRSSRSALLLDYDGTLAPFSIDRDKAAPYEGVGSVLQDIVDSGRTRLVIISGRNADEVHPLLNVWPAPEVWGSHGLQRLRPNGCCEMPRIDARALRALADAERWLGYQGLHKIAEPKPGSLAVHWRAMQSNDALELRSRILLGWFPIADRAGLSILEFDGGVELRVPDQDKGDAVRTILGEVGPNTPVAYLGDDTTDEPAFRALQNRGLTILVRGERRKSAAQHWLRPPKELLEFLSRWRDACRATTLAQTATYSS